MLPRVLIVSCGGTISSRAVRSGGPAAPAASADDLISDVPSVGALAVLTTAVHSLIPSSFATLGDALDLLALIDTLLAGAAEHGTPFAGVVVTHGTDTMEEVAFVLDLFWRSEVPLVMTGAMRNASLPGSDGPANLLAAVATAASATARGIGVLVVLNDELHAARLVHKSHTSNVATFTSPGFGPIGFVCEHGATVVLAPRTRPTLGRPPVAVDTGSVALVRVGIGEDTRALTAAAAPGCTGLVIESMGGGHLPPAMVESSAFARILAEVPVVLASRTGAGPMLADTYDFAGSEIWLRRLGVIPSGILDGLKSRILLAVLLALGLDRAGIAAAFGEVGMARHPALPPPAPT